MSQHDLIVVGRGHNGLTAACLAKAGPPGAGPGGEGLRLSYFRHRRVSPALSAGLVAGLTYIRTE